MRALETLQQVDLICAEDTRHTKRLTQRYEIDTPLMSYHKFNEAQRSEHIVQRIQEGDAVALVSDSGMPGISDPGSRLIQACRHANLPITSIPGPTALATAMALSGIGEMDLFLLAFYPTKVEVVNANSNAGAIYKSPLFSTNPPTVYSN